MDRFTGPERAFCVRVFYQSNNSATVVRRKFRANYDLHDLKNVPSAQLIKKWVKKFEETGSTLNQTRSGRSMSSRSELNVERVRTSVHENP